MSERPVRILECRFFAGMTIPETSTALGLSPSTVSRGWTMARSWLYRELRDAVGDGHAVDGPADATSGPAGPGPERGAATNGNPPAG